MRYAVYYVPDDASPLGQFGAALFGRWPDGRRATVPDDHPERLARAGRAARYGLHATLKAPFRLADGVTPTALADAVAELAAAHVGVSLDPLVVDQHGLATLALVMPERSAARHARVADIAASCVQQLDRFRAPLNEAERARRRPDTLSPRARQRLEQYGYPWVLDGFRFHLTLARGGEGSDGFVEWLQRRVEQAGAARGSLDRLALCKEPEPGAPFVRIAEFPLARSTGEADGQDRGAA